MVPQRTDAPRGPRGFPAPDDDTHPLYEAARLALSILTVAGDDEVRSWGEVGGQGWRVLEDAGVVLSAEQVAVLTRPAFAEALGFIRPRITARKGKREGQSQRTLAVCLTCGAWRLNAGPSAGSCPARMGCGPVRIAKKHPATSMQEDEGP